MLRNRDRLFWSLLSRVWRDWRSELILVRPETVIHWRERKFREFWRKKSEGTPGRPTIPHEHIDFIRRISSDHPEYGEDRIALELEVKFGIRHASSTVRRYMVERRPGPTDSQAWRSFLKNQAKALWSCDFFVQHTVGFRVLYIFVVMELANRKVIHLHVTDHPTLEWTKHQIRNACFEEQPQFLLHDNDGKFGQLGSSVSSGECREEGLVSIRIRCVALAGDGNSGDTDSVWRAQRGGARRAVDRDASSGVSRPNVDLE